MKKLLQVMITVALLSGVSLMADIKKGQKYYLKTLKSKLHKNGTKFAALHTVDEWEELFEEDAEGFIEEFSDKYPKAKKYLNSPKFQKRMPHIRDFAVEYGSDSGNVPTC